MKPTKKEKSWCQELVGSIKDVCSKIRIVQKGKYWGYKLGSCVPSVDQFQTALGKMMARLSHIKGALDPVCILRLINVYAMSIPIYIVQVRKPGSEFNGVYKKRH